MHVFFPKPNLSDQFWQRSRHLFPNPPACFCSSSSLGDVIINGNVHYQQNINMHSLMRKFEPNHKSRICGEWKSIILCFQLKATRDKLVQSGLSTSISNYVKRRKLYKYSWKREKLS